MTDFESLRDFRADGITFEQWPKAYVHQAIASAIRWLRALPALQYLGELPCWRADCPRCGASLDLWVTVMTGPDEGWSCGTCHIAGDDPASLAAFANPTPQDEAAARREENPCL